MEDRLRRPLISPVIENLIRQYKINPRNKKTMCIIVPMNEMINRIKRYFIEKGYSIGVYTSSEFKEKSTQDIFNNQIVLTNSKMFSKGIDIPNLK